MRWIFTFFILVYNVAAAQLFTPVNVPSGYFRNPLGIPIGLSANFGELRTNHYHLGLDIRTNQRENLPVYAAAEGYISRIKIERYGYGRAIYIDHPNGYTTLYAHLNDFYPELHQYVKSKQYAEEKWEQDFILPPHQFPVSKGQFIAYSGNTGGSAGPHLHFEIRDTKTEVNVNPWLFNFSLNDRIAPSIYRLYYYDRRYSTYQVGPKQIRIKRIPAGYTTHDAVVVFPTPSISFGITAEDKGNTSNFMYGIYQGELYVDDTAKFGFRLDAMGYDDARYINGAIDYQVRANGGPYIQHLSRLPGNNSTIFSPNAGDGVYIIHDTAVHTAAIKIIDVEGNASTLRFRFRYDPALNEEMSFAANSLPMLPGQQNKLQMENIEVQFPPSSFYHLVPFVHTAMEAKQMAASAVHSLHNYSVPVHDSFTVRIRSAIPADHYLRDKTVMQLTANRKVIAAKGAWDGDWMSAKFWDLGQVRLLVDTIKPAIITHLRNNAVLTRSKAIVFTVRDNAGEIKNFRAELDGKWLLFRRRGYDFIYDFDERLTRGAHELRVVVQDEAGNTTERKFTFTR